MFINSLLLIHEHVVKHLKKTLHIFILALIIISCSNSEKKTETTIEKRTLFVFQTEQANPIMDYELTIQRSDSMSKYSYRNLSDEEKNMTFSYYKNAKYLVFSGEKFVLSRASIFRNNQIFEGDFDRFQSKEPSIDGTEPILFNYEYGILGIGNSFGPDFVYLPNTNLDLTKEVITELIK